MTTSPAEPSGRTAPAGLTMRIWVPVGTPTELGTLAPGGSGFDDIWWLASVMP
jgi:hypothetical protein